MDGVIIVDGNNNSPEDKDLSKEFKKIDVAYVKLVAPTNDEAFIKETLKKCSSWIYVVSYAGLTGSKKVNLVNVKKISKLIRKNSKIPIGVGFGIRTKSDVSKVIKIAEAAIVGSGIVDIIGKRGKNHNLTKKIGSYLKNLKKGLKK